MKNLTPRFQSKILKKLTTVLIFLGLASGLYLGLYYIIINHITRIIPAVLVEVGSEHQLEIAHTDCTLVVQYCYINNIAF